MPYYPPSSDSARVGKLVFGGVSYFGAPGVIFGSQNNATLSANEVRYFPFYVYSPVTAQLIQLEITTTAAAGKLCRMGICTATFATFLPLAALVDAGSVAADSLGVKAVAINQVLAVGPYCLMINSDGTPAVRTVRGQLEGAFLRPAMGSAALAGSMRAVQTFGAFPSPTPTAPTSESGTSGGWDYAVELQW